MAYDFGFTQEQVMVRDSLRAFMREEVLPHEDVVYDRGDVPGEIEAQIRARAVAASPTSPPASSPTEWA